MSQEDYMKKRVTIYQVARESGYSLATVSRVINNKDNVTEETKRKVLETIERLGYKPSAIAQGLAKSFTTNVGIVIPSAMYSYVANMLSGMTDIAKIYGYRTTLFVTSPIQEQASEVVERVISSNVDGVVIFDDQLTEADIVKLASYQVPVAVIGRDLTGENVASIPLKYEETLRETIRMHFERGQEKVVFLKMTDGNGALMNSLVDVAKNECEKIGKGDFFEVLDIQDSYTKTYQQFLDIFKNRNNFGFYISPRDSIACGVLNAARDSNINVPEEVQIISIIGTKYSQIVRPSLTIFDVDMYEVGSIAMRMLTKLLSKSLQTRVYPFYSSIIERNSTRKAK